MKQKWKVLFNVLLLGLCSFTPLFSQVAVNASGGGSNTIDGSIEYSIGNVFYTSVTTNEGSLTEGVQHTYDITTGGTQEQDLNISLSVFPNPTTDLLNLATCFNTKGFSFELIDLLGNQLEIQLIESNLSIIKMLSYNTGTYILNILSEDNKVLQSFKIIKK
jgi:hypothetical protein